MSHSRKKGGVVLIHGLTGTPAVMQYIADALSNAGYLVDAPLLKGHGSKPSALMDVRWEDWYEDVYSAYKRLKAETDRVSAVGISLGALLSLLLAEEMKLDLMASVSIGTPLVLTPLVERLLYPIFKYTPIKYIVRYVGKNWEESVADPEGRKIYMEKSYDKIATASVLELFKLKKIVLKRLDEIFSPILILHGKYDKVAPLKNVAILKDVIRTRMVETVILENSRHVAVLDHDKELLGNKIISFLNRFSTE